MKRYQHVRSYASVYAHLGHGVIAYGTTRLDARRNAVLVMIGTVRVGR